jgi:hypothetical protein
MKHGLSRVADRLTRLVLPQTTAQAACTEYFDEYRYAFCNACHGTCRQKRSCHVCNGVKSCSLWRTVYCP